MKTNTRSQDYITSYIQLFGTAPPASVSQETSQADVLRPARGFMDEFDYTMQTMVGCPGGCLFCYVTNGRRLTPWSVKGEQGRTWGYVVRQKVKAVEKFRRHLNRAI